MKHNWASTWETKARGYVGRCRHCGKLWSRDDVTWCAGSAAGGQ